MRWKLAAQEETGDMTVLIGIAFTNIRKWMSKPSVRPEKSIEMLLQQRNALILLEITEIENMIPTSMYDEEIVFPYRYNSRHEGGLIGLQRYTNKVGMPSMWILARSIPEIVMVDLRDELRNNISAAIAGRLNSLRTDVEYFSLREHTDDQSTLLRPY